MLRDTDVVINLVAILHGSESEFERVHARLPERLARACVARRRAPRHPRQRARRHGRRAEPLPALEGARRSGAACRRPRPHRAAAFGDLRRARPLPQPLRLAAVDLSGAAACRRDARFQPVWVDDVASAIARTVDDPSTLRPDDRVLPARASTRCSELVALAGALVRLAATGAAAARGARQAAGAGARAAAGQAR